MSNRKKKELLMKKIIATLVILAGSCLFSFGEPSVAKPFSVILTALPVMAISPLMSLDLYPTPLKSQTDRNYSSMDLNPQTAALSAGSSSFQPTIRAPRAGKALYDLTLVSMIALNVADYISTKECLKYPGLAEGNPLMKPFVKNAGTFVAAKIAMTAFSYWNMKRLYKKNKPLGWAASILANAALSYVVSNNYRLLGQAKAIAIGR